MIQALLLILKIIGIALAVILGLVLFVVLVVLFVPIRYRARIIYKPEHLEVTGRVSFLFSMLSVTVRYLEKITYQGRVFGFAFLDSERKKKTKKPKKQKKEEQLKQEEVEIEQEEPQLLEEQEEPKQEESVVEELEEPTLDEVLDEMIAEQAIEIEEPIAEEKLGFFEKIRLKVDQIRETIDTIIGKIKKVWHQKEAVQQILEKPGTKRAISFTFGKVIKMLRHILPRKLKGYLIFGSDDPATTGKVLAVLSMVYARTGPLIDITPNFEEKQLECDLEIRGKIQIIILVVLAVQIILNKEVRQLIRDAKKIKDVE